MQPTTMVERPEGLTRFPSGAGSGEQRWLSRSSMSSPYISQLPVELFLQITRLLPLVSRVCLALTCKSFLNLLQSKASVECKVFVLYALINPETGGFSHRKGTGFVEKMNKGLSVAEKLEMKNISTNFAIKENLLQKAIQNKIIDGATAGNYTPDAMNKLDGDINILFLRVQEKSMKGDISR